MRSLINGLLLQAGSADFKAESARVAGAAAAVMIGRMEEEGEGERRGQFCGGVCYSPRRLPVTAAIVVMTARSDVGSVDSGLINCGTPQALWSVAHSLTNE